MKPAIPLFDPSFVYTPAAATDVQRTWRKYGWIPPSVLREAERINAGLSPVVLYTEPLRVPFGGQHE